MKVVSLCGADNAPVTDEPQNPMHNPPAPHRSSRLQDGDDDKAQGGTASITSDSSHEGQSGEDGTTAAKADYERDCAAHNERVRLRKYCGHWEYRFPDLELTAVNKQKK